MSVSRIFLPLILMSSTNRLQIEQNLSAFLFIFDTEWLSFDNILLKGRAL